MERQGGVFTAEQARRFGHTEGEIQRLRARRPGVLVSVRRGVYAWKETYHCADAAARHMLDVAALAHRLRTPAVLSHESAATHLGLELLDAQLQEVHVTRREEVRARREAGVQHHIAELPEGDVLDGPYGFGVTTIARTAVDLARAARRLECAVAACDSAMRAGVGRAHLREVHHRYRSWPRARFVSRAIDLADGRAANPGESWSRVVLIEGGLAPLDLQVAVYDDRGLIGYADFGWKHVLGELDGKVKYGLEGADGRSGEVLWKEKLREDRLRVDHEVVRWSIGDLHRPRELIRRVLAAQERARLRFGTAA